MSAPSDDREELRRRAAHLREFGVPEEAIRQAISGGDLQRVILEAIANRSAARRTVTAAEVQARGGVPWERLIALMEGFGLPVPAPDEPAFTPAEADALIELWQSTDVWPFELAVQLSRVYGRLLARIAHATVQLWVNVVEPHVRDHADERTRALLGADAFERLRPVADAFLAGVHQRWLERETAQVAFRDAPVPAEGEAPPGCVQVSLLFCDLKDFTAFADRRGDAAAVELIDQFAATVAREQGAEARLTKLLGDGFMCAYPNPQLAVDAGARIIAAMRAPNHPGVHASVHHGWAFPREGDYFGSTVNITARLLTQADRDELLATRPVVERCPDRTWTPSGTVQFRGVADAVEVFKLECR